MKLLGGGVLALAIAVGLFLLSQAVGPASPAAPAVSSPTATAPATAPADDGEAPAPPQQDSAAQGLSGLLFMFGAAALLVSLLCFGWLAVEIRQRGPAWKKQTRYPRKR
jgi:hypothetical protein